MGIEKKSVYVSESPSQTLKQVSTVKKEYRGGGKGVLYNQYYEIELLLFEEGISDFSKEKKEKKRKRKIQQCDIVGTIK